MKQRISSFAQGNAKVLLVAGLVAIVCGTTGAVAASKFVTSKKIKDGTIKLKDLNTEVRNAVDSSRAGTPGTPGPAGESAIFNAGNWGVITRNTIGSPQADLRPGPFGSFGVTGPTAAPPFGEGSLGFHVNDDDDGTGGDDTEKVSYGNEVDFFGDPVLGLTQVGFRVFQTDENTDLGGNDASQRNMPNITFEIDPNLGATASNYSSMVWVPDASPVENQWSVYLDATTTGDWYLTGAAGTATGCNISTMCEFAALQTALNDGGDAPTIYSAAAAKGRDQEWVGAIDGLRINGTVYDFEPLGVEETSP